MTDNRGGASTASTSIAVQQNPNALMHVASIQLVVRNVPGGKRVSATVKIVDPNNNPVNGATVSGAWSGLVNANASATTASNGNAVFNSAKFKKSGTITFRVTNVTKSAVTYNSSQNVVTQASISAAPKP